MKSRKAQFVNAVMFIAVAGILFGLVYIYITLNSEGSKCIKNPSGYFYTNIQKSNPNAFITCSCTMAREGTSYNFGINETGAFVIENDNKIKLTTTNR